MRLEILETRQLLAAGVSPDTSTHLENEIGWWRESQHFTPGQETRVERVGTTKDDVHVPAAIISYLNEWLPDVDFSLVDHQYGLDSEHFYFHQTISGLAVAGSAISVHLNDDGTLQSSHGIVYTADQSTSKAGPQKAENELVEKIHHHNRVEQVGSTPIVNQVWHIDAYGNRHLAFQVDQLTLAPLAEYRTWIDPISGSILGKVDRLTKANGTGRVFDPNPYQSRGSGAGLSDNNDANSAALNSELISVVLPRLDDNTGLLRGEWVDLATLNTSNNGVSTVDANEPDRIYQYTRDDPRFEQVMIYYHIDAVQAYIHSLGFDDDVGIANGIRDFPTLANAHWYTEDNSFYSLSNDAIHFGDGGVDDAEDADIILHEYGHAIQFDQNPFWGGGDMGAMGEGFSDYLAASFFAEAGDDSYQSSDVACVGEWDATSYSNTNPPCLRRVDGNKVYPDDLIGQVHADGEIWSAALWDLRGRIGGVATDQLVLEHHFSLPANATMRQAAQAILDVDQSLNGGTNTAEILAAFTPRGLIAATSAAVIEFDRDTYAIDDEVLIEVRDLDLTGQSSISVTVSTDAGDIETVTLTSSSSSTFVGGIALASSASPTRQDGTLESTVPGRLTAVYLDADDGTGSTINVDTTATVNESTDLFFADFTDANGNATDGGFTLSGSANQWHLTSRRDGDAGHSGPHSFHFGDNNPTAVNPQYSNDQFGTITSPEIDLSEMASAELRFNHYLETEPGFDFATVSVISGSQSFILAESDSELPTFTSGFRSETFDLTDFVGRTIQIEFEFSSDVSLTNEGWYVDDIQIFGVLGEPSNSTQLVINEIMINPSAVGDENGEYFELWNPGTTGVDINGYTITDNGSDSHVISTDTPLMVPGGGFVVLGRDADVSTNGGVTVHYQYSNFSLGNNGDEVIVINQTGTEIDRVEYTPGGFPIADGAAMELKLGLIDPSTQNDIGDSWQTSVVALSGGDFGTPGAANQMTMPSPGTIVGRFAFYNDSRFDNNSPAIDQNDDTAIDPTKRPLMPGQTAGPDNYVNYHRGLNGIMIDIDNLPDSQATLDDFVFSIGNDNQPNSWAVLDAVANLVVRPGAGIDGSDRVVITFPDGTIDNQWLEVTVLSSGPNRIVANDDEHYWGSAPGDTSDAGTDISVVDASRVAANFSGFFDPPITIDVPLDVNKDATVSVADRSFIVSRFTGFFDEPLQLISIPDPSDQFDIEIFFPDDTLTASQRSAFSVAANRWEEIIIGDLPDVGEIDDVRITATAPLIDGIGNILGQAGPDSVRSGSFLPLTGSMEFDAADIAALEDADRLEAVILHEMGHVLGLGTIWDLLDLLDTSDPEDPRFIGDAAVEEYNVLFYVDGNSVPVENNGGEGTALGHWEQDDNRDSSVASFGDELMTGFLTGELNPISRVTVAQFQDLGYVVNLDAADEFQPINNVAKDTHAKGRILAVPFGGLESALADAVWSRWP